MVYNSTTGHCSLIVDKTDIFNIINDKLSITNYNNSMLSYDLISNVYTKNQMNVILTGLNITSTPNGLTMSEIMVNNIRASTAEYITIDDNALITGSLAVDGDVNLSHTLYVRTPTQGGGNIRIIFAVNGNESAIGFYNRNDERNTDAGDVWVCGVNSWFLGGYIIGTPVVGNCLTINSAGNVGISYGIKTPEIMVNTVKALSAEYLTIDDGLLITGDLSLSSFVNIGDNLIITAAGGSGTIRCVPLADNSESIIAFYKYINKRATSAGDMWVRNSWTSPGFTIGTITLGNCLNISDVGTVSAAYKIMTPLFYSNTIRANGANQITLDDTIIIIGYLNIQGMLSRYQPAPTLTSVAVDMMPRMLAGIIINSFTTAYTLALPTGTTVYSSLPTIDRSIDWSLINTGTIAGTTTITTTGSTGHTTVGNMVVAIGTSGAFRTKITALNTAITYRMS